MVESIGAVFLSVSVLFVIAGFGFAGRFLKILDQNSGKQINAYLYYFALPALFFAKIVDMDLAELSGALFWGSVFPIALIMAVLFVLKVIRVISKEHFVLLNLSVVFGSNAFFGIPFFQEAMGEQGLSWSVITASFLGPIGIALALFFLEYALQKKRGAAFLGKVLLSPLILAVLAGICIGVFDIPLGFLGVSVSLIGQTASSLAIFSLGIFIYDHFSWTTLKQSFGYAGFRLLFYPMSIFLVMAFIPTGNESMRDFLLLQGGIPSAISLAVFAQRYDYKVPQICGLVIITSLLSIVVLSVIAFTTRVVF